MIRLACLFWFVWRTHQAPIEQQTCKACLCCLAASRPISSIVLSRGPSKSGHQSDLSAMAELLDVADSRVLLAHKQCAAFGSQKRRVPLDPYSDIHAIISAAEGCRSFMFELCWN